MQETNKDYSLFQEIDKEFNDHLKLKGNDRIIFSGKFGHGKTTFIKWFFDKPENKDKYQVISLFPVNYSVASNEDIFTYIKHDIILEMLVRKYEVGEELIEKIRLLPSFLKNQAPKIFSQVLGMIPSVGKELKEVSQIIEELYTKFNIYCEKEYEKKNPSEYLINYLDEHNKRDGGLYEEDLITATITDLLEKHKGKNTEKVLVIDDLDRIDPEHIFRILNVFAAHFDRRHGTKNKFGFDKIILICDIENIRNIFRAKYGADTDFNGYIDKFYSRTIFNYNLDGSVVFFINLLIDVGYSNFIGDNRISNVDKNFPLFDLLQLLIKNQQIDLRNVVKLQDLKLSGLVDFKISGKVVEYSSVYATIIFSVQVLAIIKGDGNCLKEAIQQLPYFDLPNDRMDKLVRNIVYLLTIDKHSGQIETRVNDIGTDVIFEMLGKNVLVKLNKATFGNGKSEITLRLHQTETIGQLNLTKEHFLDCLEKLIDLLMLNRLI